MHKCASDGVHYSATLYLVIIIINIIIILIIITAYLNCISKLQLPQFVRSCLLD